jgi:hypothetical protein
MISRTKRTETARALNAPPARNRHTNACAALPLAAPHRNSPNRMVDPIVNVQDFAAAELEFMAAMQEYKRTSGRMFPTWSEVLEVLNGLGYKKPVAFA